MRALAEELAAAPRLDRERFRAVANEVKARTGQKGKALFHPIRVALTGRAEGPELDLAVPAIDRGAELPARRRHADDSRLPRARGGVRARAGSVRRRKTPSREHADTNRAEFRELCVILTSIMLIYGINPVLEALRAGRVTAIRVSPRADERLTRRRASWPRSRASRCGASPPTSSIALTRGGVAPGRGRRRARTPTRFSVEDLVDGATGAPLIVVLDGIEDPHNLGAILRTVDAAGADGVVRQSRHAARARRRGGEGVGRRGGAREDRGGRQHRAGARGAEGRRASGRSAWPATRRSATTRSTSRCRRRSSWARKGPGLRRLVRERCDWLVSIPMQGHVESLNVSVAAGIALFEAVRQRRAKRHD